MIHFYDTFSTPFGDFSVATDFDAAVIATAFGGVDELKTRFDADELKRDPDRIAPVRRQILAYFDGELDDFHLTLAPAGTDFQKKVWTALRQIPPGQTSTYAELGLKIGRPGSARAVGRANATNPICLIIPCHRVIGADGSLTGFAFGEDIKRRLLDHEGALIAS